MMLALAQLLLVPILMLHVVGTLRVIMECACTHSSIHTHTELQ